MHRLALAWFALNSLNGNKSILPILNWLVALSQTNIVTYTHNIYTHVLNQYFTDCKIDSIRFDFCQGTYVCNVC